ncbi:MAG TPA: hypothetical protein VKI19_13335 [Acidimicrobiales bacterium]|nr:hypothetical protein [Acidimicrobiales bacterium]
MSQAVHHLADRPSLVRLIAAGALALGLSGGAAALATTAGHHAGHAARATVQSHGPYWICVAVLKDYGACVGPPTS